VTYIYKSKTFTGLFGFPLMSLQWTPSPMWAFSLSSFGIAATAEAAAGPIETAQGFLALGWNNQSYILTERRADKDRLTVEEKKVGVGARTFLLGKMVAEAQVGYAFGRLLYSGKGLRNFRDGSRRLEPEAFVSGGIKGGF